MSSPRIPAEEQYRLIIECRNSGLSDQKWCLQHDINLGTFYNWVKRLCDKKCYDIPAATNQTGLTIAVEQDVVKVKIFKDPSEHSYDVTIFSNVIDTKYSLPQMKTAPIEIHLNKTRSCVSQMLLIHGFCLRSSEASEDVYVRRHLHNDVTLCGLRIILKF